MNDDRTCRTFVDRLDDLLEGRLDEAERHAMEAHLSACSGCRELRRLAAGDGGAMAPPPDLLAGVLARTTGPTCASARGRLCDHADRLLDPVDDRVLRLHLDGCADCSRLAAALARLAADLPRLAETDPGAGFTVSVLSRTSRREPLAARLAAAVAAGWGRLARRPRIAFEGAFAGSVLLMLLFGAPNAPFADVPGRALDVARTVQRSVPPDAAARVRGGVGSRWEETKAGVRGAAGDLETGVKQTSTAAWSGLKQKLGTAWDRLASRRTTSEPEGDRR